MDLYITTAMIRLLSKGSTLNIPFSRISKFRYVNNPILGEAYLFNTTDGYEYLLYHNKISKFYFDGVQQIPIPEGYRPDGTGLSTIIESRLVANSQSGLGHYIFPSVTDGQTVFEVPANSLVLTNSYLFIVDDIPQTPRTTRSGQNITWPAGASVGMVVEVFN